jgi:hypothetical protein
MHVGHSFHVPFLTAPCAAVAATVVHAAMDWGIGGGAHIPLKKLCSCCLALQVAHRRARNLHVQYCMGLSKCLQEHMAAQVS